MDNKFTHFGYKILFPFNPPDAKSQISNVSWKSLKQIYLPGSQYCKSTFLRPTCIRKRENYKNRIVSHFLSSISTLNFHKYQV